MAKLIKTARAIGGVLSIATLLAMLLADMLTTHKITNRHLIIISTLISALLGIDVALNQYRSALTSALVSFTSTFIEETVGAGETEEESGND